MNSYLIESSICLASFYGFYWLFLRGEKLLSVNRFYLVFTVLASMLIPLLNFESQFAFTSVKALAAKASSTTQIGVSEIATQGNPLISIEAIYLIGLIVSICILVFKLFIVKRKVGKWPSFQNNKIEVIETEGNDAYSFFNTIFVGKELNKNESLKQQIITHELAHIEGRHSLDLLIFEVLKCVYWFNPFSYFYAKSIRLQHEYIADHSVLKRTHPKHYERSLLQFALAKVNSSLISSFNEHPIQKRLKMIQKLNSNVMNKLKPLLALPILGLLFIAYACTDVVEPVLVDEIEEVVIDLDVQIDSSYQPHLDSARIFEGQEINLDVTIEPEQVFEVRSVKSEFKLPTENEWQSLKDHPSVKSTFTKEGIEILEIPDDLIVEKPVITVKGVRRSNN
ncbi:M56 family metallopeptidase [Roseivirga sp.]|uniref:M56 family metallopeptidase n=1 Tax=Roseivirga sp. TaxID=1964215 RepID=UPI002B278201|nr:M56 family metallopeptidase [Roseivirga sp.]